MIKLSPFVSGSSSLLVQASIRSQMNELVIDFALTGDLESIVIPSLGTSSERADRLWETTCFECFFSQVAIKEYWEVNLSPAGSWNYYSFTDYRQGMNEVAEVGLLRVQSSLADNVLSLSAAIPLPARLANEDLAIGVCSVVKEKAGPTQYWALAHPAERPDFHDRRSFTITLK